MDACKGMWCDRLVFRQFLHRAQQILGLRQDRVFQNRLVGYKDIFCGHATHGCVQVIE